MSNINNNKPGQGQQNNAQRPGTPSANTNRGTQQQGQQHKGNLQGGTKPNMGGAPITNKDDRRK